jgi:hypothetical protein
MNLKETGWEAVEWTHLAHNWDKWRVVVDTEINICAP